MLFAEQGRDPLAHQPGCNNHHCLECGACRTDREAFSKVCLDCDTEAFFKGLEGSYFRSLERRNAKAHRRN